MAKYVNKVEINGNTVVDLTEDTVTSESLAEGVTAHDASGAPIVGNMASWDEKRISDLEDRVNRLGESIARFA